MAKSVSNPCGGRPLGRSGLTWPRRFFDHLLRWLDRSRQRRKLCELSDHMLKDLGLTRVDVMRESSKGFWRG